MKEVGETRRYQRRRQRRQPEDDGRQQHRRHHVHRHRRTARCCRLPSVLRHKSEQKASSMEHITSIKNFFQLAVSMDYSAILLMF